MNITFKVLFLFFVVTEILSFTYAQQRDSVKTKNSSTPPDSLIIKDSEITVNKDSLAAMDSLSLMQKKFDQFKYGDVISIANKLLLKKVPFTKDEILSIYQLKGIAHYSLSEDDAAKKSFIEILRIDTSYTLDSTKISPKIISFFRQVKQNYIQQQKEIEARTVVRIDTVYIPKIQYDVEHENLVKNAIARSLIIPGWGQLYLKGSFKGVALTILGSASLISSIYFFIRTEQKEKAYLVETNTNMIESRYNEYNNFYMYRNISLVTFGILWVYSQLDLLFFNDNESVNNVLKNSTIHYEELRGLTLNFTYHL